MSPIQKFALSFFKNGIHTTPGKPCPRLLTGKILPLQMGRTVQQGTGQIEREATQKGLFFWLGEQLRSRAQSYFMFLAATFTVFCIGRRTAHIPLFPSSGEVLPMTFAAPLVVFPTKDEQPSLMANKPEVCSSSSPENLTGSSVPAKNGVVVGSPSVPAKNGVVVGSPSVPAETGVKRRFFPRHISISKWMNKAEMAEGVKEAVAEFKEEHNHAGLFLVAQGSSSFQQLLASLPDSECKKVTNKKHTGQEATDLFLQSSDRPRALECNSIFTTLLVSITENIHQKLEKAIKAHPPADTSMSLHDFIEQEPNMEMQETLRVLLTKFEDSFPYCARGSVK